MNELLKTIVGEENLTRDEAISVLSEPEYFKGDIKFANDIKSRFSVPVICKDLNDFKNEKSKRIYRYC